MENILRTCVAVFAAEALVAQRNAELQAARKRVWVSRKDDLLAQRPDLLQLAQIIQDHPCRQLRLSSAQRDYQDAFKQRMAEAERDTPFQAPAELTDRLEQRRWLAQELRGARDADLEAILCDPRPDDTDRRRIISRIEANRKWVPAHSVRPSSEPTAAIEGSRADAEWDQYVQSVSDDH